jgi:hypothetical protein
VTKPELFAFVAKEQTGGWWTDFDLMPLWEAHELVQLNVGWHLLVDPSTEIALGTWEREHNQRDQRWQSYWGNGE